VGCIITLGWFFTGDFSIGVLPVIFLSVGDAVTGLVRNFLFKKRTKSWWGNLAMMIFCVTVGTQLGIAGVLAGGVSSVIEHFELYPLDDNITVPLISFVILLLAKLYAPWLLAF
jgi:dolichol kinase